MLLFVTAKTANSRNINVIGLYNEIPRKKLLFKYKLKFQKKKLVARTPSGRKARVNNYDLKNGFLTIKSFEKTGAYFSHEVALANENNKTYVCVSEKYYAGITGSYKFKFRIFRYGNNKFITVTDKIMAKISIFSFLNKSFLKKNSGKINKYKNTLKYLLKVRYNIKGSFYRVNARIVTSEIKKALKQKNYMNHAMKIFFKKVLSKIRKRVIYLKFNPDKNIYEIN